MLIMDQSGRRFKVARRAETHARRGPNRVLEHPAPEIRVHSRSHSTQLADSKTFGY